MKNPFKIESIDYHRNGISGLGFHVAIVNDARETPAQRMLVIRFNKEADKETGQVVCAAFNLELLKQGNIKFAENSFRGDHFHEEMDKAIAALK